MVNYYSTPGKHVKHKLYLIAEIIFFLKMFKLLFSSVFPHFTQFEEIPERTLCSINAG